MHMTEWMKLKIITLSKKARRTKSCMAANSCVVAGDQGLPVDEREEGSEEWRGSKGCKNALGGGNRYVHCLDCGDGMCPNHQILTFNTCSLVDVNCNSITLFNKTLMYQIFSISSCKRLINLSF